MFGKRFIAATLVFAMTAGCAVTCFAEEQTSSAALPSSTAVAGIYAGEPQKSALPCDSAVAGIALDMSEYSEVNSDATMKSMMDEATISDEELKAREEAEAKEAAKKAKEKEEKERYKKIAIARVSDYVHIRKKPNTDSEIVGKIYNNSAATIIKTVDGEDGKWYKIKSGSCKGYMKAEYFVTGKKAQKIAKKVGRVLGTTTASSLRLREKASTESKVLTLLDEGSEYSVLKEGITNKKGEEFVKVLVSEGEDGDDVKGYVSADYVDVTVKFKTAISIEEELAEQRRQEELRRQEEEAAAEAEAERNASSSSSSGSSGSSSSGSSGGSSSGSSGKKYSYGSGTGAAIAAKAQQYVGWLPYVWGGTSLSSGADCSGFVQAIYSSYGVSVPRTSSSQAYGGRSISRDQLQPGDLVFYGSGGINHVAIYIGGGMICHEANSARDCAIDSMTYCGTPVRYATYLH